MSLRYEFCERATANDLNVIDAGIEQHNTSESEIRKVRQLAIFARDKADNVKGGAVGRTWGQCCELQQLWVTEEERGHGIGSELIDRFEQEALKRGCSLVYLETFTFQAPLFYQQRGYRVALETKGFSNGIIKYTLQKTLQHP